jgi:hypothetical protein
MTRALRAGLLLVALLGAALQGMGQSPAARARVMVEFIEPEGGTAAPYAESFASALVQSPAVLAVVPATPGEDPLAVRAARSACSLAISLRLASGTDSSRMEWKIYAPPGEDPIDQGAADKGPPELLGLATTFWLEPVSALERAVSAQDRPASFITIVAEPGTLVSGLGEDIVLPESGTIDLPLALPAYLVWSAESKGALRESGATLVKESGTSLVIPRRLAKPDSPWSLDASLFGFSFPELSARYAIGPRLFLRATFTQYLFGLALTDWKEPPPDPSLLASIGLIQPGLGLGFFFSPPSSSFRLYSTLDLFARIEVPSGEPASFDPVAPMGSALSLGFDWGRSPALRVFFEGGIAIYPWAYPGLMLASSKGANIHRITLGGTGLFTGHPGWFAELPIPRLGLRIRL